MADLLAPVMQRTDADVVLKQQPWATKKDRAFFRCVLCALSVAAWQRLGACLAQELTWHRASGHAASQHGAWLAAATDMALSSAAVWVARALVRSQGSAQLRRDELPAGLRALVGVAPGAHKPHGGP
jgi:hypothetical protein